MEDGSVWKLDTRTSEWTDITPERPSPGAGFGYAAVAVDAPNPDAVLASTFGRPGWGVFRSDSQGERRVRITDPAHQWGLILQVTGDPDRWGRVYVGTHGRGVLYGNPPGRLRLLAARRRGGGQ
jgi:hypothetical protein